MHLQACRHVKVSSWGQKQVLLPCEFTTIHGGLSLQLEGVLEHPVAQSEQIADNLA